jgi:hypothetical protein
MKSHRVAAAICSPKPEPNSATILPRDIAAARVGQPVTSIEDATLREWLEDDLQLIEGLPQLAGIRNSRCRELVLRAA